MSTTLDVGPVAPLAWVEDAAARQDVAPPPGPVLGGVVVPWSMWDPGAWAGDEGAADAALDLLARIEEAKADLDALSLSVARRLAAIAAAGAGAPGSQAEYLGFTAEHAQRVLADEIHLATGLAKGDAEDRVAFVTAPAARTQALEEALAEGRTSWARARYVFTQSLPLDDADAQSLAAEALAPPPAGEAPVTWQQLRRRVRTGVARRLDVPQRRAAALAGRRAYGDSGPEGCGVVVITGSNERVAGAQQRIEAIARAVRAAGDSRTLDHLRADIALDLLLFGVPDSDCTVAGAADWTGLAPAGLPAARVDVVVSLATLLGHSETAGQLPDRTPVPAHVVRDLAIAEGSTWRRIVTDPATGYAIDVDARSYRPPPHLARFVRVRDGGCRAPGCTAPATHTDLDHVRPYTEGGPTAATNLHTLNRAHHTPKTSGLWKATLARDGTATWRTLTGRTYTTHPRRYDDGIHDDPPPF